MVRNFGYIYRILLVMLAVLAVSQASHAATRMRINMSAHIIESSIANLKDTQWTLYKSTAIQGSDTEIDANLISTKLNSHKGSIYSIVLGAGQYVLKAEYGNASVVKIFKVEKTAPNGFLNLKIVFNLGALNLSSTLGNEAQKIESDVDYVIRNAETDKIILETSDVSKTYYLNQGEYNISAKFSDITVTDAKVNILANNTNNVIIRHKVGQIELNLDNIKSDIGDKAPIWRVIGAKNRVKKEILASENQSILLPVGDYSLLIDWKDFSYSTDFGIHPGQVIEFKIPKQNG